MDEQRVYFEDRQVGKVLKDMHKPVYLKAIYHKLGCSIEAYSLFMLKWNKSKGFTFMPKSPFKTYENRKIVLYKDSTNFWECDYYSLLIGNTEYSYPGTIRSMEEQDQ